MSFAVAIALLFQSLLLQSHVDPAGQGGPSLAAQSFATSGHAVTSAERRAPSNDAQICPLCRELAQSGHYVAAAEPTLDAVAGADFASLAQRPAAAGGPARSHAWNSRAPPITLHT